MKPLSLYLDTSVIGGYFDPDMAAKVVPVRYAEDADHVAVAVAHQMDLVVSWNFKHLVNIHRERGFNAVNRLQGYAPVRIVNP